MIDVDQDWIIFCKNKIILFNIMLKYKQKNQKKKK